MRGVEDCLTASGSPHGRSMGAARQVKHFCCDSPPSAAPQAFSFVFNSSVAPSLAPLHAELQFLLDPRGAVKPGTMTSAGTAILDSLRSRASSFPENGPLSVAQVQHHSLQPTLGPTLFRAVWDPTALQGWLAASMEYRLHHMPSHPITPSPQYRPPACRRSWRWPWRWQRTPRTTCGSGSPSWWPTAPPRRAAPPASCLATPRAPYSRQSTSPTCPTSSECAVAHGVHCSAAQCQVQGGQFAVLHAPQPSAQPTRSATSCRRRDDRKARALRQRKLSKVKEVAAGHADRYYEEAAAAAKAAGIPPPLAVWAAVCSNVGGLEWVVQPGIAKASDGNSGLRPYWTGSTVLAGVAVPPALDFKPIPLADTFAHVPTTCAGGDCT